MIYEVTWVNTRRLMAVIKGILKYVQWCDNWGEKLEIQWTIASR